MIGKMIADDGSSALEPIAVIGIGCRFAGQASSIEGFWDTLRLGRKEHGKVPAGRYQAEAWEHPYHERRGAINNDSGFFLQGDPGCFDAPFFSITAKEAAGMDPVQRMLLEVAYEAFENGGVPMESLAGSDTGVYSGCMTNDYELLSARDILDMPHNSSTGNGRTMLANRLSWFFDLRGPSIMLDTACSSSLTAFHVATQALRAGECRMAMVTGANMILHPNFAQRLSYMHMLSPDGISNSFDDRANGYGRGEGFGAVLLKPLSQALADGDAIRAIVRATGAGQDGRTPGITMPSAEAQADLIRATYRQAGLSMSETSYFEAHGTGTGIGDPTELSAIGASFGAERAGAEPVYVGSVKGNLGHTEGAAGVASVIKVILCLERGMLVPNAGFENLNPRIRLDAWGMRLSDAAIPWPAHLSQRASVNSFGFGGSNAHVVLESASQYLGRCKLPIDRRLEGTPQVVVVSTHDKAGVNRMAEKWTSYLDNHILGETQELVLSDMAYTVGKRRSQLGFRSFAVVDSFQSLRDTMAAGLPSFPRASRQRQENLAFICTGQGAQWARMGLELLANPIFQASVQRSHEVLQSIGCPWDLFEEISADKTTTRMNEPSRSQPICCILQIALVDLLASWQVSPRAVVGHSSGEVGAAYAAGYLTHEDAVLITYWRGVVSEKIAERGYRGKMLAAGLSASQAQDYLTSLPEDSVVVACINSPSSVTLSGDADQIDRLEATLQADGHFVRQLRVTTAYHSPHMRALADEYRETIECVKPINRHKDAVAMFSSVTKERVSAADLGVTYWTRNLVSPVEFEAAVTQLATMTEAGRGRRRSTPIRWTAFVEIGPHDALRGPFAQILQQVNASLASTPYTGLVKRNVDARQTALQAAGVLWSIGLGIDLHTVNGSFLDGDTPRVSTALPSYAWNHQSTFWHEPLESQQLRQRTEPRHDTLGVPIDYQNDLEPRWRNFLSVSEQPWIGDHIVAGAIIFPGAGMVAMVAEVGRQLSDPAQRLEGIEFYDLEFVRGVVIPSDDRGLQVSLHVAPHPAVPGWYQFGLFSLPADSPWVQHTKGAFALHYSAGEELSNVENWETTVQRARHAQSVAIASPIEAVYSWLSGTGGVSLGPTFRSMASVAFAGDTEQNAQVYVSAVVPDTKSSMPHERESPYYLHPTALDALFQAAVISCSDALSGRNARFPIAIERLYLSTVSSLQAGDSFAVHVETTWRDGESRSDVTAADPSWEHPVAMLQGVRLGRVPVRESGPSGDAEIVAGSRFSSLHWGEHIDSGSGANRLADWIQRVCHTHGDARVLVIADANGTERLMEALRPLAPHQTRRPRLQQLTVVRLKPEAEDAGLEPELGAQTVSVASLEELTADLLGEALFDAILIDHPDVSTSGDRQALLDFFLSVTQPDAWIAIQLRSDECDAGEDVHDHEYWDTRGSIEEDCLLLRRRLAPLAVDPVVYLLTAATDVPTALVTELQTVLRQVGATGEPVSIDEAPDLTGTTVISLVELDQPWTTDWTPSDMQRFQALLSAQYLLWVQQNPDDDALAYAAAGATTGLLRTVRNEQSRLSLPQLLVDASDREDPQGLAQSISQVLQLTLSESQASRPRDWEFAVQHGRLLVPRLNSAVVVDECMDALLHGPQPTLSTLIDDPRPLRLQMELSEVDGARWVTDDGLDAPLLDDQVEVQLDMVSLADRGAHGNGVPEVRTAAMEGIGMITRIGSALRFKFSVGDRVLCVLPGDPLSQGLLATHVRLHEKAIWTCPKGQEPTQSLSMPVAYAAAHASLFGTAKSAASVLILGSPSQTLRATVDCALAAGMQVYVAVEPDTAVESLTSRFPALKGHIVPIHRDTETTILRLTSGRGVDLSIACLAGAVSRLAARCLAPRGQLVDLSGALDLGAVPRSLLERGGTVRTMQLSSLLRDAPEELQASFQGAINLLGNARLLGAVDAHPVFPISQLADAVAHSRTTQARVIVDLKGPGTVPIVPALPTPVALPADATYVLVGGLGTIGLALADTLADCGARHVVFASRSDALQESQQAALDHLQARGVRVDLVRCNVARQEDVQSLLDQAETQQWRIRGIVQCATVLRDGMFEHMGYDAWTQSTESKIRGTWHLHQVFADTPLDFFIALSSAASVIGNMGQANYAAGNAFMDALMDWRRRHALVGHSIGVGLVPDASGVGDVAESPDERRQRYRHIEGTELLLSELQTLVRVIVQDLSPVPARAMAGMTDVLPRSEDAAPWQFDRKFDHRVRVPVEDEPGVPGTVKTSTLLKKATSLGEAAHVVSLAFQEYLARAMATAADSIDLELPLSALGVDSLKAAEVQNWVAREMGTDLSSFEFLGPQPVRTLAEKVARGSSFVAVSE